MKTRGQANISPATPNLLLERVTKKSLQGFIGNKKIDRYTSHLRPRILSDELGVMKRHVYTSAEKPKRSLGFEEKPNNQV